ncbi:hypothetical protein VdG1_05505 [Verticillium dahliae VDG1]|nr:hypothetical protein VdG1_05505 [Verticillium dahliae VDG1]
MTHHRLDSDEEDKDDDLPEPEDDDEEDEELEDEQGQGGTSRQHPEAAGHDGDGGGGGTGKDAFPESEEPAVDEIQILDLHTEHPLFGYRNRIFKGSWSRADGRKNRVRWHARGRGRGKGAIAGGQAVMDRPELLMDNGENSDEELSTPTPDKWSDLEGTFRIEGHDDDVEMAEAGGNANAVDAPEGEGSRQA